MCYYKIIQYFPYKLPQFQNIYIVTDLGAKPQVYITNN